MWLGAMKSSKAKHVPFIIEFINKIMCTSLENPNMFSDDIIGNTLGKYESFSSLFDVSAMLNGLYIYK